MDVVFRPCDAEFGDEVGGLRGEVAVIEGCHVAWGEVEGRFEPGVVGGVEVFGRAVGEGWFAAFWEGPGWLEGHGRNCGILSVLFG